MDIIELLTVEIKNKIKDGKPFEKMVCVVGVVIICAVNHESKNPESLVGKIAEKFNNIFEVKE